MLLKRIYQRIAYRQDFFRLKRVRDIHHVSVVKIINQRSAISSTATNGLAGVPGLHSPDDFLRLAKDAVGRCEEIRVRVISRQSKNNLEQLRDLDSISNIVCSIVDAAEFVRNVHFEVEFREAAEETFEFLSGYITELNTETGLYGVLQDITACKSTIESFNEEQSRVATLLQTEFERDGIHLPLRERIAIAEIQNDIVRLETAFNANISKAGQITKLNIPASLLQGVPMHLLPKPNTAGFVEMPLDAATCNAVLRNVRNSDVRRQILHAQNAACSTLNSEVLSQLISARHKLAQSLGFESYAHRSSGDKMIGEPQKVMNFLENVSNSVIEKAQNEMELLQNLKLETEGVNAGCLQSWDLMYYMSKAKGRKYNLDGGYISNFFTLDGCMKGIGSLCQALFGIHLIEKPMEKGESWYAEENKGGYVPVKKMILFHPSEGTLGTIYMDLGSRPGKFPHAAHYTIRCGCANRKSSNSENIYQTPIVALVTSFGLSSVPNGQRLLSHGEVETLLHEFGHALHSLLSRTEFQHVSGTRGPIDWVEVPSHLMEYFAWDSRSLALLSSHYSTGEAISNDIVNALRESKGAFAGLETQQQLLYSVVDQKIFGPQINGEFSVEQHVSFAHANFMRNIPYEGGKAGGWQYRFSHFTGYGAGYYSYLYDRMLAANIWSKCFAVNPLSRQAGEKFRRSVLSFGGAKDPHEMLADILNRENPSSHCLLQEWKIGSK